MDVLYLVPHPSATKSALTDAAVARGLQVVDFHDSGDLVDARPHAYGGPKFMARLAEVTDVSALEPDDDWLVNLPWAYRRREIRLMAMSEARTIAGRAFIKTPRDKDFEAGMYSGNDLPRFGGGEDPMLLVSDVVTFTREYRLLVLDGRVRTASRYLTGGRLDVRPLDEDPDRHDVLKFAHQLLGEAAQTIPSAVTIDVGWAVQSDTGDSGPAVVEANMAWFSNIYDCAPHRALDVMMRAAGPRTAVTDFDLRFARIGHRPSS